MDVLQAEKSMHVHFLSRSSFRNSHTNTYRRVSCGKAGRILQNSGESIVLAAVRALLFFSVELPNMFYYLRKICGIGALHLLHSKALSTENTLGLKTSGTPPQFTLSNVLKRP